MYLHSSLRQINILPLKLWCMTWKNGYTPGQRQRNYNMEVEHLSEPESSGNCQRLRVTGARLMGSRWPTWENLTIIKNTGVDYKEGSKI